jgi:hypothetical protein
MIPIRRRLTPTYTRRVPVRVRVKTRRPRTGPRRCHVNHEGMFLEQPRELPVATVLRASAPWSSRIAGDLQRWLLARWAFLRPRMVPVIVAAIGMVLVLNAVNYLAHPPAPPIAASASTSTYDPQPSYGFHVKLVLQQ